MFIRVKSTPNSPRRTVQIVENIRNGHIVSQKIVHYIGVASNAEEEAKLKTLGQQMIIELELAREQASKQQSLFPVNKDEIKDASELRSDKKKKAGRPKKGDISQILPTTQVSLSDLTETCRIIDGVHEVGGLVYKQIGFSNLLKGKKDNDLLTDIVLSRIFEPTSKRGQVKNLSENFGKEYDVNQVYRLMDKVAQCVNSIRNC